MTTVVLFAFLAPMTALAQSESHRYGARDEHGSAHTGYTTRYALDAGVRRLAYQSKIFQWNLESELNRSRLDGTLREKRANQLTASFNQAAETLHSLYAVGRNVDNSASEAANVLRLGNELDEFMSRAPVSRSTSQSWDSISCELSSLEAAYDLDADAVDDGAIGSTSVIESHSAAMSYGRIWRWQL
jgi:hypothetical protein